MNTAVRIWRRLRNGVNKVLVQLQHDYLRNERVFGRPFQLTLESGNVCNLACPLCPTTHREARLPRGVLRLEDARRIIDSFPYTVQLVLSNWGEPFLNADIFAIIAHAKDRDIRVLLESNFTLFDEEKARRLVESRLDTLVVALDGATQEGYERYRVGGDLARAVANVELLRRVQRELGCFDTELEWKFVLNRYNEGEVEAARAWAERLGMRFSVISIWAPEGEDHWRPSDRDQNGSRTGNADPEKCHNLWQAVSVNFNGDVFPCCSEFSPEDRIVNVLEERFEPHWNSALYRSRRRRNVGAVDCSECHVDKETNWYRRWKAGAAPPDTEDGPA